MIISASRRTDIPAFYSDWFIQRVRAGFLLNRNPFNPRQVSRISLAVEDVDAIVFWTRNPTRLMPYLLELDSLGYRYYFQYTLTGYPRALEAKTLHPLKSLEVFKRLSDQIGKEKVVWRYDPILLSNLLPFDEHLRLFGKLAESLNGYCRRVVISFADIYAKTARNLKTTPSLIYTDIAQDASLCQSLARELADIARANGMEIFSCAEPIDLTSVGIAHGKCIDEALLKQLFAIEVSSAKDRGQREGCGCVKSVDIGAYNTCLHGCRYCYATSNHILATENYKRHSAMSPFLLGDE